MRARWEGFKQDLLGWIIMVIMSLLLVAMEVIAWIIGRDSVQRFCMKASKWLDKKSAEGGIWKSF